MKAMELLMKNLSRSRERPVDHQLCLDARVQGTGPSRSPSDRLGKPVSGREALSQPDFPTDHCMLLGENHAQQNWLGGGEGVNKEVSFYKAGKF